MARRCAPASSTCPACSTGSAGPRCSACRRRSRSIVSGYDLERLQVAAEQVRARMVADDRFADVKTTVEAGNPEIQIVFDQERASQLGLVVRDVADRVVNSVRGEVATRYKLRDKQIDVLVRSVDTRAASRRGDPQPDRQPGHGLSGAAERRRRRAARGRAGRGAPRRPGARRRDLRQPRPRRPRLGGDRAARDRRRGAAAGRHDRRSSPARARRCSDSFRSMQFVLLLAIFLVYLVMASQFESLMHPFVILLTIPLAITGAVWALWLTGTTVNVVAYIGLIMLAGIVVNQSIVLIDAVNQARERGLSKHEAIVEAGTLRLRPILITKLTTILGLLPMALGLGEGAEVRAPMAITVIGGVLLTTFLTLLVIPVVYAVLDRKTYPQTGARGRAGRGAGRPAEEDPMRHTQLALQRPVTTLMMALAVLAVGLISTRLLRLEAMPDITFPGHAGDHPLPRLDARGNGAAGGAARSRRRSRRCPASRKSAPPPSSDQARVLGAVQLGPRPRDRGLRGAHQDRLDPPAAARRRRPHPDVLVQRVRPAGHGDPHRLRPGPDRPVRHAREVPEAADRAARRRRARRAAGRRAARAARAGRAGPARGLRRRRAGAAHACSSAATSR